MDRKYYIEKKDLDLLPLDYSNIGREYAVNFDKINKKQQHLIVLKNKINTLKIELNELNSNNKKLKNHLIYMNELIKKVAQWHHDRNLIEGASDKDQFCKLIQEAGELSDNICKGKDVSDDIGDMIVVLINIAERNNLTLEECLERAWDDIKDRKGKMVDGIFIKEGDS